MEKQRKEVPENVLFWHTISESLVMWIIYYAMRGKQQTDLSWIGEYLVFVWSIGLFISFFMVKEYYYKYRSKDYQIPIKHEFALIGFLLSVGIFELVAYKV